MKNRRGFLAALTVASGVAAALPVAVAARAGDAAATPAPSPSASDAHAKQPSASALAFAATFRAFDSALSDAEIEAIAREIDDSRAAGAVLNPRNKPLRNGDEMVVRFVADQSA